MVVRSLHAWPYRKSVSLRLGEFIAKRQPMLPIHDVIKTTTIGSMAAYLPEVLFLVRIPEGY
jgi:hypothetical protein